MSLTWLSGVAVAAGLAGLAALLYWMQRLRVRHREVEVVTTLFWRAALEETRARVFQQRFRHPWAYALILAIASLAWLAVAAPRLGGAGELEHVLILDGSAGMAWGTRFADAVAAARERASDLPRASTRVLLAGSRTDTLLAPGEDLPLLDARLAGHAPEATPASVQRALLELAQLAAPERRVALEVFGDAPVDAATLALLPVSFAVTRADLGAFPREGDAGIAALGVSEAASGAWDKVDLYVELGGARASDAALTLDGAALAPTEQETTPDGRTRLIARDLPAHGGRVDVRVLRADAFALDDAASLVLPERPLIQVALSASVPPVVRAALEADPGVALVEGAADVVVRAAGEDFGGEVPALELNADEQGAAFVVSRPRVDDADEALRESFELLGLRDIDTTGLATQTGRTIELALEFAPRRAVALWAALLDPRFDFTQSRAFPLFLGRSVRWLAQVEPFASDLAAGERIAASRLSKLDGVGDALRVPRAGAWSDERGRPVFASLLDLGAPREDALQPSGARPGDAGGDLVPWIVALALALLALEWWLVRTERIP